MLLSEAIAQHQAAPRAYQDFLVPAARLTVEPTETGYVLKHRAFNGQHPTLGEMGKTMLCKLLGMSKGYFEAYPEPGEFLQHVKALLTEMGETEVLVRVLNGEALTVLPKTFIKFDDIDILAEILPVMQDLGLAATADVEFTFDGAVSDFRIVKDQRVLRIRNTELGVGKFEFSFGILNYSAYVMTHTGQYGSFGWAHKGQDPAVLDIVKTKLREALNQMVGRCAPIEAELERIKEIPLLTPPADVLNWMVKNQVLSGSIGKVVLQDLQAHPEIPKYPRNTTTLNWYSFVLYLGRMAKLLPVDLRFKLESNPFLLSVRCLPWSEA